MTITKETATLVDERDQGHCAMCGGRATNRHHRKLRRHNDDTPANMLSLCGTGTTGCHGEVTVKPKFAYAGGWSLRSFDDPTKIPILIAIPDGYGWFLHDLLGGRTPVPNDEAVRILIDAGLRDLEPKREK